MNSMGYFDSNGQCHLVIFRPHPVRSLEPDYTIIRHYSVSDHNRPDKNPVGPKTDSVSDRYRPDKNPVGPLTVQYTLKKIATQAHIGIKYI